MATLGNIGEKLDLLVKQGSTLGPFNATMKNPDGSPVNMTGMELRAQIRRTGLSPAIVATIPATITNPVLGQYTFGLSDEATAAIPAGETLKDPASKYVWDMELEDAAGNVMPLYYGDCKVFREVTRA
jgi:hypothetical protein